MPVDVRKLIFSKEELLLAFKDYCWEMHLVDKQEPIEGFILEDKPGSDGKNTILATVQFASSNPKKPHNVKLNSIKIFEILVSTCRKLHIPLPRKGTKFVQKHKEGLIMVIGLNEKELKLVDSV